MLYPAFGVFFFYFIVAGGAESDHNSGLLGLACTGDPLDELLPRVKPEHKSSFERSEDIKQSKAAVILFATFLIVQTKVASDSLYGRDFILHGLTTGFLGAIFAIPIAHELMHSRMKNNHRWAVLIMAMFSYPHFCLEHLYGHHRKAGTHDDPATARAGESIYAFLGRTLCLSLTNSWKRECARLRVKNYRKYSSSNRIIVYFSVVFLINLMTLIAFGTGGALFFVIQALTGIITLESVNYIEHYGLRRQRTQRGTFERISNDHSWNSDTSAN